MTKRNENVVRRLEEAYSKNKFGKSFENLFASNFHSHSAIPGMDMNPGTMKMVHGMSMQAMPDRQVTIEDIFSAGDRVVVRCHATGTNTGGFPWFGAPANGNKIDFEWVSIFRFENGKIVEHWGINDGIALLVQTGVWQPPQMG